MKMFFQSLLLGTLASCCASETDIFPIEEQALITAGAFRKKESPTTFFGIDVLADILKKQPAPQKTAHFPSPIVTHSSSIPTLTEEDLLKIKKPVYCDVDDCEFSFANKKPRFSLTSLSNHYKKAHLTSFKRERAQCFCLACNTLFPKSEIKKHIMGSHTLQDFALVGALVQKKEKGEIGRMEEYLKKQHIVFHCQEQCGKALANGEEKQCESSFVRSTNVTRHYAEIHPLLKKIPTHFYYHCTPCNITLEGRKAISKHIQTTSHEYGVPLASLIKACFSTHDASSADTTKTSQNKRKHITELPE